MTNQEFLNILHKEAEYNKQKMEKANTDLQKEFWKKQLDIVNRSINEFKQKTEGTH